MARFVAIACLLATVTTAAHAQPAQPAFTGTCADYRTQGRDACIRTGWCRWQQPKGIKTLPDGRDAALAGSCVFKPGYKAAYKASQ